MRKGNEKKRKVLFSEVFSRDETRDCISFLAEIDGAQIQCLIPGERLVKDFGARAGSTPELIGAFRQNWSQICEMARKKIERGIDRTENEILI